MAAAQSGTPSYGGFAHSLENLNFLPSIAEERDEDLSSAGGDFCAPLIGGGLEAPELPRADSSKSSDAGSEASTRSASDASTPSARARGSGSSAASSNASADDADSVKAASEEQTECVAQGEKKGLAQAGKGKFAADLEDEDLVPICTGGTGES